MDSTQRRYAALAALLALVAGTSGYVGYQAGRAEQFTVNVLLVAASPARSSATPK